ncbi:Uncharacterised protein [Burkholderia pseudomallei]|nr:Uncharacterised protein [Burkholderia pseudomallei]CAJ4047918.1 Uncharacterised protein [Burkholderia pseudomallei]CAJ4535794.1 Uncharacterised protein [Burkholderia pseudomallei]CAJ5139557.1 Uncharacterised protein [Burkholderia pseudomallei]CAJ5913209.1 Uncharacterised protein [Burkholderia pseudomallei]
MVWPSRRHVTFFSNRPRALNHYTRHEQPLPHPRIFADVMFQPLPGGDEHQRHIPRVLQHMRRPAPREPQKIPRPDRICALPERRLPVPGQDVHALLFVKMPMTFGRFMPRHQRDDQEPELRDSGLLTQRLLQAHRVRVQHVNRAHGLHRLDIGRLQQFRGSVRHDSSRSNGDNPIRITQPRRGPAHPGRNRRRRPSTRAAAAPALAPRRPRPRTCIRAAPRSPRPRRSHRRRR